MRLPGTAAYTAITLPLLLAGCSTPPADESSTPPRTEAASPSRSAESSAAPSSRASESPVPGTGVVGTVVHFSAGEVVVKVVIVEDNPTTRSFIAMLPMTLEFSDYGSKEKVATPTGEWDFADAEGLNPEAGDLFSYMPWGNLGFFYNAEGNTFSNDLTKIGESEDIVQIKLLDGQQVTIAVAG
ncbi:hypothetical protein J2790_003846 [Paenarthrobacter nicotinovorans]|uniref:cyclophilin-like fold protein n=1 Tax=Micrococcaceae TaxID=1268 RepID=UPI0008772BE0|nr:MULTISPECIES: cyclophilin-like fold protein [Micrococcaceae]MDR6438679.1 hypothetical protein [Paenarthrobacter nicotinovorans]SCZ56570.1 hypothetical protein SAMN02799638_01892 [Arthrobacter sp. UNCCL28]